MAYTIGAISSVLTVEEKHRILIDESLNQDSVYIRLKETLLDLLDKGEIKGAERAQIISGTLTGMASSITSNAMNTALAWATKEKEMELQILQLESKLALEDEALKTSYVERVAKDKQAALMGLDSVVRTVNTTPELVYIPKYEDNL